METLTSVFGSRRHKEGETKRLTPADYADAGILKSYDWSVKDREIHDKDMEKYRHYLMKLCQLSSEVDGFCEEE